jgi:hypothetical protein
VNAKDGGPLWQQQRVLERDEYDGYHARGFGAEIVPIGPGVDPVAGRRTTQRLDGNAARGVHPNTSVVLLGPWRRRPSARTPPNDSWAGASATAE